MNTLSYKKEVAKVAMLGGTLAVAVLGTGSCLGIDSADKWFQLVQPRVPFEILVDKKNETPGIDVRSVVEHIENIRAVFDIPISELSALLMVSRQAIYKWLGEEAEPETEKLAKITSLSHVADKFRNANITRASTLLKIKTFNGKSFIDLFISGESTSNHVISLINEAHAMQASYKKSGLSSSKAKPTNDWQSSFSIPGSLE